MPDHLVVGVAVVYDGRVLAARRTSPPAARGRWELPGGKARPGEDAAATAVREIEEELGCTVRVDGWLEGAQPVRDGLFLRVATAVLTGGEPIPREHDAVWWLGPEDLAGVPWLAPDRPFLPQVRAWLRGCA